jgi:hypothetical protein
LKIYKIQFLFKFPVQKAELATGDAALIEDEKKIDLSALDNSEVLLFELAT